MANGRYSLTWLILLWAQGLAKADGTPPIIIVYYASKAAIIHTQLHVQEHNFWIFAVFCLRGE